MLSSQSCFEILQALQGKSSQVLYSVSSKHRVCTLQFTEFFRFNTVQQSVLWVNRDSNCRITQCKRTPRPQDKSIAGLFLKGLLIKSFQGEKRKNSFSAKIWIALIFLWELVAKNQAFISGASIACTSLLR